MVGLRMVLLPMIRRMFTVIRVRIVMSIVRLMGGQVRSELVVAMVVVVRVAMVVFLVDQVITLQADGIRSHLKGGIGLQW